MRRLHTYKSTHTDFYINPIVRSSGFISAVIAIDGGWPTKTHGGAHWLGERDCECAQVSDDRDEPAPGGGGYRAPSGPGLCFYSM